MAGLTGNERGAAGLPGGEQPAGHPDSGQHQGGPQLRGGALRGGGLRPGAGPDERPQDTHGTLQRHLPRAAKGEEGGWEKGVQ